MKIIRSWSIIAMASVQGLKILIGTGKDTLFDDRDRFRVNCYYTALDSILSDLRKSTTTFETFHIYNKIGWFLSNG